LLRGERPALEFEAHLGCFRKVGKVFGFGGGQIAFCCNVKTDAVQDFGWKVALQPESTDILVLTIDAVLGDVLAKSVEEVPNVME
jgi:hypothetical protein